MAGKNGGSRPGSGRKPRATTPACEGISAEEYLRRVVQGIEPPDVVRVAAARSLLRFEVPIRRAPPLSQSSKELSRRSVLAEESRHLKEFEQRAAKTRAEHAKANGRGD